MLRVQRDVLDPLSTISKYTPVRGETGGQSRCQVWKKKQDGVEKRLSVECRLLTRKTRAKTGSEDGSEAEQGVPLLVVRGARSPGGGRLHQPDSQAEEAERSPLPQRKRPVEQNDAKEGCSENFKLVEKLVSGCLEMARRNVGQIILDLSQDNVSSANNTSQSTMFH